MNSLLSNRNFPYLFIIILALVFHWRLIFLGEVYAHSDVFICFYPLKALASESLKSFAVPLWNPYWFTGHPFLAESQVGFFYPINLLLFYLFPAYIAYSLSTVIHYTLAGIFTYLLARKLKLEQLPSLLSAITFTFSGFYVTHTFHIWANQSAVWLPLFFLFVEKIYDSVSSNQGSQFLWTLLLGLILGIHFFVGHYNIQLINTMAVVTYYILKLTCVSETRHSKFSNLKLRYLYHLFIFLFISIGISAIQWLPSLEESQFSSRGKGLSFELANENLFHPLHFITFIFPYFFGYGRNGFYGDPYWGFGSLWETCGYVGVLSFVFAMASVLLIRNSSSNKQDVMVVKILSIIAVIFMLLAMGKYGLIYIPLHHLPVIKVFRCPGRFLITVTLALSLLAGFGFQYLISHQPSAISHQQKSLIKRGTTLLVLISFGIILSLNLGSFLLKDYIQSFDTGIISKIGRHYDALESVFIITSPRVFIQLIIILTSAIIVKMGMRNGWGGFLKASAIILTVADLFYFGMGYNESVDSRIYTEEPESAKILKSDKSIFRIYSWKQNKVLEDGFKQNRRYPYKEFREIIPNNSSSLYRLQQVSGVASITGKRNLELLYMDRIKDFPIGTESELIKYPRIMDMLNVKYILSSEEVVSDNAETGSAQSLELIHDGIVKIYKNRNVLPRAYIVSHYKIIAGEDSIWNEIKGVHFDPQKYAILEEQPDLHFHIPSDERVEGDILITDYKNETVKIIADIQGNGLLVLGDTWFPGWKAFVDGIERKIYRVNYIQRGVFLEHGKHNIDFVYTPASYTVGKFITLFTLLSSGVIFIYIYLKSR